MRLDRGGDVTQERVAGAMTVAVVDLLEPVDIDAGENQMAVSVLSPVDLVLEQQQPDLPAKRPSKLIQLCAPEVVAAQTLILNRARAIFDRCLAISGRKLTISRALAAVRCSAAAS